MLIYNLIKLSLKELCKPVTNYYPISYYKRQEKLQLSTIWHHTKSFEIITEKS